MHQPPNTPRQLPVTSLADQLRRPLGAKLHWVAALTVSIVSSAFAADRVLVMGIGEYVESPLHGVKHDRDSALKIAKHLGFSDGAPTVLDERTLNSSQALLSSLQRFQTSIQRGDRVFVYYSGHGQSRAMTSGKCEHGLLASDLSFASEDDVMTELKAIASRASDVTVVMDACHSGGLAQSVGRTRSAGRTVGSSWVSKSIEPKGGVSCADPSNFVSRGVVKSANQSLNGNGLSNVVLIAAAGANEHAIDDPNAGGLATQSLLKCLSEKLPAKGGAAATVDDLIGCTQRNVTSAIEAERKIDPQLRWLGQNVKVGGNIGRPLWAASETVIVPFDYQRTKAALQQVVADQNQQWNLRITPPPASMAVGEKFQLEYAAASPGYFSVLYASADGGWCQLYPQDGGTRFNPETRGKVGGRKQNSTQTLSPTFTIEGDRGAENTFVVTLSGSPPNWSHLVSACDESGRAKSATSDQIAKFAAVARGTRTASMKEESEGSTLSGYGAYLFSVKSK